MAWGQAGLPVNCNLTFYSGYQAENPGMEHSLGPRNTLSYTSGLSGAPWKIASGGGVRHVGESGIICWECTLAQQGFCLCILGSPHRTTAHLAGHIRFMSRSIIPFDVQTLALNFLIYFSWGVNQALELLEKMMWSVLSSIGRACVEVGLNLTAKFEATPSEMDLLRMVHSWPLTDPSCCTLQIKPQLMNYTGRTVTEQALYIYTLVTHPELMHWLLIWFSFNCGCHLFKWWWNIK